MLYKFHRDDEVLIHFRKNISFFASNIQAFLFFGDNNKMYSIAVIHKLDCILDCFMHIKIRFRQIKIFDPIF